MASKIVYKPYATYYGLPMIFPNVFSSQSNMEICNLYNKYKNNETRSSTMEV